MMLKKFNKKIIFKFWMAGGADYKIYLNGEDILDKWTHIASTTSVSIVIKVMLYRILMVKFVIMKQYWSSTATAANSIIHNTDSTVTRNSNRETIQMDIFLMAKLLIFLCFRGLSQSEIINIMNHGQHSQTFPVHTD